jgi:hypothetical protein
MLIFKFCHGRNAVGQEAPNRARRVLVQPQAFLMDDVPSVSDYG